MQLSGTGKSTEPGRITIQGIKTHMDKPAYLTVSNYYGSMLYMNSFFMEPSFPAWEVSVKGAKGKVILSDLHCFKVLPN